MHNKFIFLHLTLTKTSKFLNQLAVRIVRERERERKRERERHLTSFVDRIP